jgi:hypothetical protein
LSQILLRSDFRFVAPTPLAKTLLGTLSPFMVAGLFYLAVALAWLSQYSFDVYAGRWANGTMKVAFTPRKLRRIARLQEEQ